MQDFAKLDMTSVIVLLITIPVLIVSLKMMNTPTKPDSIWKIKRLPNIAERNGVKYRLVVLCMIVVELVIFAYVTAYQTGMTTASRVVSGVLIAATAVIAALYRHNHKEDDS